MKVSPNKKKVYAKKKLKFAKTISPPAKKKFRQKKKGLLKKKLRQKKPQSDSTDLKLIWEALPRIEHVESLVNELLKRLLL